MQDKPPRMEWGILEKLIIWASILVATKILIIDKILSNLG